MFIDVAAIAILLTLLCGGNPWKVVHYPYRYIYLFPIPLVLQLLGFLLIGLSTWLNLASYIVVIILMFLNLKVPGISFMTLGTAMNAFATIVGRGRMPVVKKVAETIGIHDVDAKHVFVETSRETLFLGDITTIRFPWGRSFVISIGDLLISLGIMVFFLSSLRYSTQRKGLLS